MKHGKGYHVRPSLAIVFILCALLCQPSLAFEEASDHEIENPGHGIRVRRTLFGPRKNVAVPTYTADGGTSSSDKENSAKRAKLAERQSRKNDPSFRKAIAANAFAASDLSAIKDNLNRPSTLTAQVAFVGRGKGTGDSKTFDLTSNQKTSKGYIDGVDIKGHMLGARLGGKGGKDYIFPQNKEINNSGWKKAEGKIASNIKRFGPATVRTTLTYDGNNQRCTGITCQVSRANGLGHLTQSARNPTTLSNAFVQKQAARAATRGRSTSILPVPKPLFRSTSGSSGSDLSSVRSRSRSLSPSKPSTSFGRGRGTG